MQVRFVQRYCANTLMQHGGIYKGFKVIKLQRRDVYLSAALKLPQISPYQYEKRNSNNHLLRGHANG